MRSKTFKLEDEPIWKESSDLAELLYAVSLNFPEEEKFVVTYKLQSAATDFLFWIAMAVGNPNRTGREQDWGYARKFAAGAKTMYRFAARQGLIKLDPSLMLKLDKLLDKIEIERLKAAESYEKHKKEQDKEELKPWLKKYEIWKQITKDKKHG